jgi:hypothetical protein
VKAIEQKAIAKIGNCQRIQIEDLLCSRFGWKNEIEDGKKINFGDVWQFRQFWQSGIRLVFYGH